jgi:hypothetical protein
MAEVPVLDYAQPLRWWRRPWVRLLMLATVLLSVILVIAVMGFYRMAGELIGGMQPHYPARDYDRRLTAGAQQALPIIEALQNYHEEHGEFPADAADLQSLLPSMPIRGREGNEQRYVYQLIGDWSYARAETTNHFWLGQRLGWDPSLNYEWDGTNGTWVFDPGDGSPARPVLLNPRPLPATKGEAGR